MFTLEKSVSICLSLSISNN